ncbi:rRNA maturation RNase YbeY [Enterobacteriaceae endosymbiont of Donacia bicoloricornis]|uniref:rRNA maturation RNase YbeY n=1 Tax=Enterobacteriaceae endosymbiont of Donacia bicoloricornis TaxID=2675772 RepID=UPI001448E321|nr:rRNA maturation RNase YbeY [Enterobacteriaceae endosymbiont of Donacia bicoloricornis]QJC37815.1 rRNA maturation RNase YbeY [Enterobacteriaceae endosymbiont of Donacia bicoloricornis]
MGLNIILNYYNFCKNDNNLPLKNDILFWLYKIFSKKNIKKITLNISIVEKNSILKINKKYLKISKPTNVLSFLLEKNFLKKTLLGELILCKEIIEYEAFLQEKLLKSHWAHIIIHSCLHLLNFNHKDIKETCIMQLREIKMLNLFGYKNPYF